MKTPVCLMECEPWWRTGPLPPAALPCATRRNRYLFGDCYELAQAVAALTGWEPVTVDMTASSGHAMVRLPGGLLLDAAGLHDPEAEPIRVHERLITAHRQDPVFPFREWCLPDVLDDAHELLAALRKYQESRDLDPLCLLSLGSDSYGP